MFKKIGFSGIFMFAVVIASFVVAVYFYPQMPERLVSHWNGQGQPNGYMGKFWGLFLMPIISVILFAAFILMPKLDPKRENIEKFKKYFDLFISFIFAFLFYIYLLTIFWNLGYQFDFVRWIIPAFSALFYVAGMLIEHAQPNWTIGIRTPWTLSSSLSWQKTHALGGKLFKISAIVGLLGLFVTSYALWLVLVPILFSVGYLFIYSYLVYKKDLDSSK